MPTERAVINALRNTPSEIFPKTIFSAGGGYLPTCFVRNEFSKWEPSSFIRIIENLSNRELQVLSMIGAGKAVKEIAAELHLSANTIRTFWARILEKIGAKGTSELIHYAIAHNLTGQ